jgi:RND family efflux transporter MFP subunit
MWMVGGGLGVLVLALLTGGLIARPNQAEPASKTSPQSPAANARSTPNAAERRAVAVTVESATLRPLQRTVPFVGTFAGYDEVSVMAEVTGRVIEVCHDVGDLVRPGDVLLRIDPTDYQLAVEETRRSLEFEATRIGLPIPSEENFKPDKILPILRDFDVSRLPTVLRAKEEEENSRRKAERAQKLRDQNIISQEVYDQAITDYQVAQNTRTQAQLDARSVVAGIRHRLVLLKIAEEKLRRANVTVPTPTRRDGMPADVEYAVAERKVTEGEMLKDAPGSSTAVFDLVLDKVLKVDASAPEQFMDAIKVGQKVEIRDVEAFPGRTFTGTVSRVSPVVDRTKHSFQIEALLENAQRDLKPGGYARGVVLTRVDPQALVVPTSAVVTYVGSTKVFVLRDGKAHAVPVTLGVEVLSSGPERQSWVELVKPDPEALRPGVPVITSGHNQLAEGVPVEVRKAGNQDEKN